MVNKVSKKYEGRLRERNSCCQPSLKVTGFQSDNIPIKWHLVPPQSIRRVCSKRNDQYQPWTIGWWRNTRWQTTWGKSSSCEGMGTVWIITVELTTTLNNTHNAFFQFIFLWRSGWLKTQEQEIQSYTIKVSLLYPTQNADFETTCKNVCCWEEVRWWRRSNEMPRDGGRNSFPGPAEELSHSNLYIKNLPHSVTEVSLTRYQLLFLNFQI